MVLYRPAATARAIPCELSAERPCVDLHASCWAILDTPWAVDWLCRALPSLPTPVVDLRATIEADLRATPTAVPKAPMTPTPDPTPASMARHFPVASSTPVGVSAATGATLARPWLVDIARGTAVGSGGVASSDVLILTNAHIVEQPGAVRVTLSDGRVVFATQFSTDTDVDLALLRVPISGLQAARFGDSSKIATQWWRGLWHDAADGVSHRGRPDPRRRPGQGLLATAPWPLDTDSVGAADRHKPSPANASDRPPYRAASEISRRRSQRSVSDRGVGVRSRSDRQSAGRPHDNRR
jgi:hypothetical protein